jgi:hypothetical protein
MPRRDDDGATAIAAISGATVQRHGFPRPGAPEPSSTRARDFGLLDGRALFTAIRSVFGMCAPKSLVRTVLLTAELGDKETDMIVTVRTAGLALLLCSFTAVARAQSLGSSSADPRDRNLRAYVELLRSDVRAQKVAILTELMALSEEEDAAFWPIYRAYDVELAALNDQRVRLIADYAKHFSAMTDAAAERIAHGALDFEAARSALKLKYFDKMRTALSAKQAARFLQIEGQLLLLIDLQISAALPIVE